MQDAEEIEHHLPVFGSVFRQARGGHAKKNGTSICMRGTLNQRARQQRWGGGGGNGNENRRGLNGKAAAAEVTARLGKSADVLKSGATKGETTYKLIRNGKTCPHAAQGC
eukprot:3438704-Pyramimonas_sp.AAC.1